MILDELCFFTLLGEKIRGNSGQISITPEEEELYKILHSKEFKGIHEKLKFLKNYNVETTLGEYLETFRIARNCITHRAGVVGYGHSGIYDLNDGNFLTIKWRFFTAYHINAEGNEEKWLESISDSQQHLPKQIICKLETQQRSYSKGQRIHLEPIEIDQICLNFDAALSELIEKTENYLAERGVVVSQSRS